MTEKQFKQYLLNFDKAKKTLEQEKMNFKFDVIGFMRNNGIPVKVLFFGNTFGLDIDVNIHNFSNVPRKIPLNVLSDFCEEFGCDFEYTNCDGERYIFSFNGLNMGI